MIILLLLGIFAKNMNIERTLQFLNQTGKKLHEKLAK